MRFTDLIIGEYYTATFSKEIYTFIHNGTDENVLHICNDTNNFSKNGWAFYHRSNDIRPATPDEKCHLDLCVNSNEFVPYTYVIKENYEVW